MAIKKKPKKVVKAKKKAPSKTAPKKPIPGIEKAKSKNFKALVRKLHKGNNDYSFTLNLSLIINEEVIVEVLANNFNEALAKLPVLLQLENVQNIVNMDSDYDGIIKADTFEATAVKFNGAYENRKVDPHLPEEGTVISTVKDFTDLYTGKSRAVDLAIGYNLYLDPGAKSLKDVLIEPAESVAKENKTDKDEKLNSFLEGLNL